MPPTFDTALVIDPDGVARNFYTAALEPLARVIDEAEDGAEALGKAIRDRPALILTEAQLPRVNGFDLCTLLRHDPATAQARIVVVTSALSPVARDRATAAGADAVLTKPCTAEELVATVRQVCGAARHPAAAERESRGAETAAPAPRRAASGHAADASVPAPRMAKSRTHARRRFTTAPPVPAPPAFCPDCAAPLTYLHSHTGGVSEEHAEQWDYFRCGKCGLYRYRHRTRRMTRVVDIADGSRRKPA